MAPIIENQRVTKRNSQKTQRTSSSRSNNKSAGFDTGFMSQFSQKPARQKKRKNEYRETRGSNRFNVRDSIRSKVHISMRRVQKNVKENTSGKMSGRSSGRNSGFSFPIPSAANLAVIAGVVLVALAALKWDGLNIAPRESYLFNPSTDAKTAEHSMNYAATGIPYITALPVTRENTGGIVVTSNVISRNEQDVNAASAAVSETSGSSEIHGHGTTITPDADSIKKGIDQFKNDLIITFKWEQYRVKKGDSVSSIAKKFNVSIGAIIASNEIKNARALQEGALLRIPNIDGIPYSINKGDTLSGISASFKVPLDVILDVNDIKTDKIRIGETIFIPGARMNDMDLRLSLGELFIYPVSSRHITSGYGMRKVNGQLHLHTGIDIRANTGTPVTASLDGVISATGENWMYGKHIIMSHNNGYKTLYAHLNSISVKQGDRVARGKKIGESGNTGYTTGAHLHFAIINKNGKFINPLELLN